MPQLFLNRAQVCASTQEVSGAAVSQRMWVNTSDPIFDSGITNNAPHRARGEPAAVFVSKQGAFSTHDAYPSRKRARRWGPERDHAIPPPLALADRHQALIQIDVRHVQRNRLADANARPVQQLEQGTVADLEPAPLGRVLDNLCRFVDV
jgi:hypothetical protein